MHFPTIKGRTVNGDGRTLPDDFSGELNVVLVAFTQAHQYDVDSWLPFLGHVGQSLPGMVVYELPVLEQFPFYQRWMIDYWMYTGIPDADVRDRTITLYTDVPAFLSPLALPNTRQIYQTLPQSPWIYLWGCRGR